MGWPACPHVNLTSAIDRAKTTPWTNVSSRIVSWSFVSRCAPNRCIMRLATNGVTRTYLKNPREPRC